MSGNILDTIFDKKGEFDYLSFSGYVEKRFQPVTFNRTLYVYDPETSLYAEDAGGIEAWTQEILEDAVCSCLMNCKTPFHPIKREVLSRTYHHRVIPGKSSPFDQFNGIPAANGVIVFDKDGSVNLIDYRPDMMFTRRLPINYRPDADPGPIDAILREWVDDPEDVLLLYQLGAQSLVQALPGYEPCKKSYLLQGPSNSGKSSFIDLYESVFGRENVSSVSLTELTERFNKSALVGKFLNLVDDIQVVNLKNAEVFKAVTGRRSHEIERKYQDRFSADITAVHCYSCNEAPILDPVVARDSGFKSRWYFIQFSHTFPVDAGWHAENFTGPHLEGFFSRMVDTAAAMLKNGGRLLLEADPDDVINRWQNSTRSPLAQFIEQHAERGESYSILKDSFCEAFWEWIEGVNESAADKQARRRRSPQTKTAMSQSLIKLGIYPDQVGGKNRSEVYKGIRLKPTSPYVSDSP